MRVGGVHEFVFVPWDTYLEISVFFPCLIPGPHIEPIPKNPHYLVTRTRSSSLISEDFGRFPY